MSDDGFFDPPAFSPADALLQMKRSLRELRGLAGRGEAFEWKGQPVLELRADDAAVQARLAKRPARSPDWEARTLKNNAEVRRFVDDVKQRVARWREADD